MSGLSIDWVTVSETFGEPVRRGAERFAVDGLTGEFLPRGVEPLQVAGDRESSVRVSSDGSLVRFSGNPSRWNRCEAVVGRSVESAKAVVNRIMVEQGFPAFGDSARLSRLDLNRNLCFGARAPEALRVLSSRRYGRLRQATHVGSVSWGADSKLRELRVYDKAAELRRHVSKHRDGDGEYLEALCDQLEPLGVLRFELELRWSLAQFGLLSWSELSDERCESVFTKEVLPMAKLKRMDLDEFEGVPFDLVSALTAFFYGFDLRKQMSRSRFYRVRKQLLALGYDVSKPVTKRFVPKAVYMEAQEFVPLEMMRTRLPEDHPMYVAPAPLKAARALKAV